MFYSNEVPKRGRGRPPKNATTTTETKSTSVGKKKSASDGVKKGEQGGTRRVVKKVEEVKKEQVKEKEEEEEQELDLEESVMGALKEADLWEGIELEDDEEETEQQESTAPPRGKGKAQLDPDVEQLRRFLSGNGPKEMEEEYRRFRVPIMQAEKHLEKGRYAEAIALYEETARKFPPNHYFGDLYMGIGCAYMGLEQPKMAIEQFQKGLTFDPLNLHIWMNLGIAQVSAEELAAAVETFDTARGMAVEAHEEQLAQQCAVYVGQISEDLGNEQRALEVYQEALKFSPRYSQLWYLAGCILQTRGQRNDALRHFEEAARCECPWPSAFYKLSKLVEDPQEKRRLFQKFVDAQKELAESGNEPLVLGASKQKV